MNASPEVAVSVQYPPLIKLQTTPMQKLAGPHAWNQFPGELSSVTNATALENISRHICLAQFSTNWLYSDSCTARWLI